MKIVSIFVISVLVACLVGISNFDSVFAQTYNGVITLDSFPSSGKVGEIITFTGVLNIPSPQGEVIYIKDKDTNNSDDLLATAFVKSNGKFSVDWVVVKTELDNELEIYAVFEGNNFSNRLTTCEKESTATSEEQCVGTIPFRISTIPYIPPLSIIPKSEPYRTSEEHMELFYSLNLEKPLVVAIIPDFDSYDLVKIHIPPVKAGILMWKYQLQEKFGGDWRIDFEIKEPGKKISEPDVMVNLVLYDDNENKCGIEYDGFTTISQIPKKPVQAFVCSTLYGATLTQSGDAVKYIAGHEFIHAVGLGHTFNSKGDMMCSTEDGKPTCPNKNHYVEIPSDFNLASVAKIYGTDGFKNPNNAPKYKTQFTWGEYLKSGLASTAQPNPSPSLPKDSDNDGIDDSSDQCIFYKETFNGYQDTDGCPDIIPSPSLPKDSDNDGIDDSSDQCIFDKETFNGYQDTDGCPDIIPSPSLPKDSDNDGIDDSSDQCIFYKETFNGYQDTDGCPDTKPQKDSDKDGIVDSNDICPYKAEVYNGYIDWDGCPDIHLRDLDSDGDGISDLNDKCPYNAETYNEFFDDDGCPDYVKSSDNDDEEPTEPKQISSSEIPNWIKNNAKWWAVGSIPNSEFSSKSIFYLADRDMVHLKSSIPQGKSVYFDGYVPSWFKISVEEWADGKITNTEFVKNVQSLIEIDGLKVK